MAASFFFHRVTKFSVVGTRKWVKWQRIVEFWGSEIDNYYDYMQVYSFMRISVSGNHGQVYLLSMNIRLLAEQYMRNAAVTDYMQ